MRKIFPFFILAFVLLVYRPFFLNPEIIGGDWPYYFAEYLNTLKLPELWSPIWPTGLGGNQAIILPLKLYLHSVVWVFVSTLGISWEIVQRIFFFGLFFILSVFSSYKLTKSWLGVLIYSTNTWILMVSSGGQVGIMLSYSIAPLVLFYFFNLINEAKIHTKNLMIASLIFSIQLMFDTRIAFLTLLIALFYFLFQFFFEKKKDFKFKVFNLSIVGAVSILIHSFWIIPSVFIALKGGNVASIVDKSSASLDFFSFAKLENSISLLHPNWPENIFGKVFFLRPEFLIIPIVVFLSLFFKSKGRENKKNILFFSLIGLFGAFLAKGTQEPFGFIFSWLYLNFPGFSLFRDPVKFYVLVAISYSLLIPISISQLPKFKRILSFSFIVFWIYLNIPIITNSEVGTFKQRTVPSEYVRLKDFIDSEPDFFRTFWIPSSQRFAFVSENHPVISSQDIYPSGFFKEVKDSDFQKKLSDISIKYLIVPYDSEGEIFLNDRKYDDRLYKKTLEELDKIPWLKKLEGFGKIAVYEIPGVRPHRYISEGKLIFSESFDPFWHAEVDGNNVYSKKHGLINSFEISNGKDASSIPLKYEPEEWARIGYLVSTITFFSVLIIIGIYLRRK